MSIHSTRLLLKTFNLTTMASILEESINKAERENWTFDNFLSLMCENELQERKKNKIQRLLRASKLPDGKTLSTLNLDFLPVDIKRKTPSLIEGKFVEKAVNLLAFGLPGRGKTHLLCALANELILKYQYKVLFSPTFKIIQMLQNAKEKLELEKALKKLDSFDIIIIDDIGVFWWKDRKFSLLSLTC